MADNLSCRQYIDTADNKTVDGSIQMPNPYPQDQYARITTESLKKQAKF